MDIIYCYVYTWKDGEFTYERTYETKKLASDRVKELIKRGFIAVWTTNTIPFAYY